MVYRFIDHNKESFGLRWLLRKFNLSPNAYYNYRKHNKAAYEQKRKLIQETMKDIYYNHNRIIGHRGMVIFLARKGIALSKTTAHKYMNKALGLHSIVYKKKPKYIAGKPNKVFPNLLKQHFKVETRNTVWCTDFTYIKLSNGKMCYNCTIIDLNKREVIATVNSRYIDATLAITTLQRAIAREHPAPGLILHSDQGAQFASWNFIDFCKSENIVQSMSKAGCPYDNAPMERFYKTFKSELINIRTFENKEQLDHAVHHYVYVWYNHIRPHSYNGGLTPFEAKYIN